MKTGKGKHTSLAGLWKHWSSNGRDKKTCMNWLLYRRVFNDQRDIPSSFNDLRNMPTCAKNLLGKEKGGEHTRLNSKENAGWSLEKTVAEWQENVYNPRIIPSCFQWPEGHTISFQSPDDHIIMFSLMFWNLLDRDKGVKNTRLNSKENASWRSWSNTYREPGAASRHECPGQDVESNWCGSGCWASHLVPLWRQLICREVKFYSFLYFLYPICLFLH